MLNQVVVFNSEEERNAFRESPAFDTLLQEVQLMHGDLQIGPRRFDATAAVSLKPSSSPPLRGCLKSGRWLGARRVDELSGRPRKAYSPSPSGLRFPIILDSLEADIGAEGRKAFRASTDRPA